MKGLGMFYNNCIKNIQKIELKNNTMTKKEKIERFLQVVWSCDTITQKTVAVNWSMEVMRQMNMDPEEIFKVKLQFFRSKV